MSSTHGVLGRFDDGGSVGGGKEAGARVPTSSMFLIPPVQKRG